MTKKKPTKADPHPTAPSPDVSPREAMIRAGIIRPRVGPLDGHPSPQRTLEPGEVLRRRWKDPVTGERMESRWVVPATVHMDGTGVRSARKQITNGTPKQEW